MHAAALVGGAAHQERGGDGAARGVCTGYVRVRAWAAAVVLFAAGWRSGGGVSGWAAESGWWARSLAGVDTAAGGAGAG